MTTVTMCPTLANPDAFSTVNELREQLNIANLNILSLADDLNEAKHSESRFKDLAAHLSNRLVVLAKANIAGNQDVVKAELDSISASYKRELEKRKMAN